VFLSAVVASLYTVDVISNPSASAEDVVSQEIAERSSAPVAPTRNVRVIDISAENAVTSDQTKWHDRAPKRPVQKNTARTEASRPPVEARALEKPKKKIVPRTASPNQDAYSAYASEQIPRRGGSSFFRW
jgi:hypothetical protein